VKGFSPIGRSELFAGFGGFPGQNDLGNADGQSALEKPEVKGRSPGAQGPQNYLKALEHFNKAIQLKPMPKNASRCA
jgi:hypothetical protein